ncbi:MAG: hypothetical protein CVV64_11275 [Candidatus Wallbacteria bacterium HGW-Wallbacteria-1]|jgi:hypothetical protein|uniref:Fungal lipase-like domain-containing protein n=1 Tax=Candidatus Wallbacteria bacterium HGW-Wallbacteria-1 TaxID=2013854 RepID=A0A2N1PP90_9BACT|nr:MAG: hypothetical protein CVV64_11275 [Candidatus Wallbacteria bacterium HGW-Wallbacteria-1]
MKTFMGQGFSYALLLFVLVLSMMTSISMIQISPILAQEQNTSSVSENLDQSEDERLKPQGPSVPADSLAGGIHLKQLSHFAQIAAQFHKPGFAFPAGINIVSKVRDIETGFQAYACRHESTGNILIAISGTQFADPMDLLADLGIIQSSIDAFTNRTGDVIDALLAYRKSVQDGSDSERQEFLASHFLSLESRWVRVARMMESKTNYRNAALDNQINQAREFVRKTIAGIVPAAGSASVKGSSEAHGSSGKVILVGHSLGGFICQVIASETDGLITHTFNAPGASAYIAYLAEKKSSNGHEFNTGTQKSSKDDFRIASGTQVFNHLRRSDPIGRFGRHLGNEIIYSNARTILAIIPLVYIGKNHTMPLFVKEISAGLTGYMKNSKIDSE